MANLFKISDRVRCIVDHSGDNCDLYDGETGTVCNIEQLTPPIGVRWDVKPAGGHGCGGHCEFGYGWYVYEHEIYNLKEGMICTKINKPKRIGQKKTLWLPILKSVSRPPENGGRKTKKVFWRH